MNKNILLLILPLLSFVLLSCDDEKDIYPMDLHLLDGIWEVVEQGNQDIFERGCLLDLSTSQFSAFESLEARSGNINTFYLAVGGKPIYDKRYSWHIREMKDHLPLLEVELQAESEINDRLEVNHFYTITKLTDANMWWQYISNGDNSIIKFRLRKDITIK